MTHYRRALDQTRGGQCVECEARGAWRSDLGAHFCDRHARVVRRYYPNQGPDRTPLVYRVLLGLACGVIVVVVSVAIWAALLRAR